KKLGAHHYIDSSASDPAAALQALGGAKVILITASGGKTVAATFKGLRPGGGCIFLCVGPAVGRKASCELVRLVVRVARFCSVSRPPRAAGLVSRSVGIALRAVQFFGCAGIALLRVSNAKGSAGAKASGRGAQERALGVLHRGPRRSARDASPALAHIHYRSHSPSR